MCGTESGLNLRGFFSAIEGPPSGTYEVGLITRKSSEVVKLEANWEVFQT